MLRADANPAALHGSDRVKNGGTATKHIPFMKSSASKQNQDQQVNDSYKYFGIEAILAAADKQFIKFPKELDYDEEDEISDEELRSQIKSRKAKELAKRDGLTTVKCAALQAI